jgi:hypothetical protein
MNEYYLEDNHGEMYNKCSWASYGKMSEQHLEASFGKYVEYSRLLLGSSLNGSYRPVSGKCQNSS